MKPYQVMKHKKKVINGIKKMKIGSRRGRQVEDNN
jgi:hypothetical protein